MIKGKDIQTIVQDILTKKAMQRDFVCGTQALQVITDGEGKEKVSKVRFVIKDGKKQDIEHVFTPTKLCFNQLASKTGIPRKYAERMEVDAPELLATNINWWFKQEPEKRMLRTYINGEKTARAFVSSKYRCLGNDDIAAHILPRLSDLGCEIKSAEVTEKRLYIQAIHTKTTAEVKKVGDVVHGGVVISNSEVGCGSLNIEHLVYTLRCTNGMIGSSLVKRNHVGRGNAEGLDLDEAREHFSDDTRKQDDKAFWMKVSDTVSASLTSERLNEIVGKLNETAKVEIDDPMEVVEVMSKKFEWEEDESKAILNHFLRGGMPSQYGLLNAVTRTAQDSSDYDRAIELERQGAEIMELPPTSFN